VPRKSEPVTVIVVGVVTPIGMTLGEIEIAPGAGFATGREAGADVPPPGAGLTATSEIFPGLAKSDEVIATLAWVELIYVVVRVLPFTCIVVAGMNPVPVTDTTATDAPVATLVGENPVTVGDGLSTSNLMPDVPLELAAEPFAATTER
jgi:hypothetical protein